MNSVAIIDYGSGNLRSAAKAFERAEREAGLDFTVSVTDDPKALSRASHIVLPGVGAFADCMAGLDAVPGIHDALTAEVIEGGKPFLGICVGMQLMAERGLEHGAYPGLGWIAGDVVRIEPMEPALKIPHMGWNDLQILQKHPVLAGIENGAHAYFVHSYQFRPANRDEVFGVVDYGGPITAIVGRDNLIGTQFHPEKSQKTGLTLIRNFLGWRP